jgi:hypothetical protein
MSAIVDPSLRIWSICHDIDIHIWEIWIPCKTFKGWALATFLDNTLFYFLFSLCSSQMLQSTLLVAFPVTNLILVGYFLVTTYLLFCIGRDEGLWLHLDPCNKVWQPLKCLEIQNWFLSFWSTNASQLWILTWI